MWSFLKEFLEFLRDRRKIWLIPVVLVLILIGFLMVAAQSSVLAPLIYTLF
jgi:uncharacterized membrane protein YjdF